MAKKLYTSALTLMCSLKLKVTRVTREKLSSYIPQSRSRIEIFGNEMVKI